MATVSELRSSVGSYPALRPELEKCVHPSRVSDRWVDRLAVCRDSWPLAHAWFLKGEALALPDYVVWPETAAEVSALLMLAGRKGVPVVPYGEGSGVVGGALASGGILLDLKRMNQITEINDTDLTVTVGAGINGENLERALNAAGFTCGHIPQSARCSTVGGWIAPRGTGQFSTRYGKIEEIIVGLEAVFPTGQIIRTRNFPRATGPRYEQLMFGSEGTLGVVTEATLRVWPYPETRLYRSFALPGMRAGLETIRRILRHGVRPAVVRLYDDLETGRHFPDIKEAEGRCILVLLMEGDPRLVAVENAVCQEEALAAGAVDCGEGPVQRWLDTRFDVSLSPVFLRRGAMVDTIEISGPWHSVPDMYDAVTTAMMAVEGTLVASAHCSHAYPEGACLYMTFCGFPPDDTDDYYRRMWDAVMQASLACGGSISHHHGIGIARSRWMESEHGAGLVVLRRIKQALDPNGIMNPGKLGMEGCPWPK